jgi:hypothetical protein
LLELTVLDFERKIDALGLSLFGASDGLIRDMVDSSAIVLVVRIHPLPIDFSAALLLEHIIAFQIDFDEPLELKGSYLHQLLEDFDVVEDGNSVESQIKILKLEQLRDIFGHLRDEVVTEVDEFQGSQAEQMFYFAQLVVRQVQELQIDGSGEVRGNGADVVVAEVDLADLVGLQQVRNLPDFALASAVGLLLEKVAHCY